MKNIIILTLTLFLFGCTKEVTKIYGCKDPLSVNYNSKATDDDGTCKYKGKVVFGIPKNLDSNITVTIGNNSEVITKYYSTYNPDCSSIGCAIFTLPPGIYEYTAKNNDYTWSSGTIYITTNGCSKMLLHI